MSRALAFLVAALWLSWAHAGGPFGIDHGMAFSDSGIWARKYQVTLELGVIATEVSGALWLGNDDDLGHVFWQSLDASLVSGLGADGLKRVAGRTRPDQGNNPNAWFKGSCCASFPSGEVTLQASFITPFIIEYGKRDPWIWVLEVLPVYDGIARMKSHAHWQSDVVVGWVLGSGVAYWTSRWKTPLTVRILPRGVSVGLSKRF